MEPDCPSSNPSSTNYGLCDLGRVTKPVWASGFSSRNLEIISNYFMWLWCGLNELKFSQRLE